MVCVLFYVICIVELLVSSVICRFSGLVLFTCAWLYEFSFILFIHHNVHTYFELCTYCKIWDIYLLKNMNSVKYLLFYMELFCDMFGSVLECYELTHISWSSLIPRQDHASLSTLQLSSSPGSHARVSMHCYPIGCVIRGICSCILIVNFLKFTFYHGMVTSVIFLIKNNLNRHIKHENPLSIYENVDYFQIMSITNLECFCINCSMIW